ncbi:zona pellucida protein AX 1 [Megalops cyprinoides]|uniref:zona pellucida protein AX 1 n=1 Tax=Megalops cyprinoides TaxID=118141 RepID=UPI001864A99E|nr:zona pellucida protein AX 1 [Megalops cyprinoides]
MQISQSFSSNLRHANEERLLASLPLVSILYEVKRTLWLLLIAAVIRAQKASHPHGLDLECLGNILRLTLDQSLLWGHYLEVDAINGTDTVPITDSVASQCGFGMKSDPWGNAMLFASVHNCFAQNMDDEMFDLTLRLRLSGSPMSPAAMHTVSKSCTYTQWASREIICNRNYMEVSVRRQVPDLSEFSEEEKLAQDQEWVETAPEAAVSSLQLWKVQFHGVTEKTMSIEEAHSRGYGLTVSTSRLLLRSPYSTPETLSLDVAGVPMQVIKATTYFRRKWMVKLLDSSAACPTGGVTFTEEMITWHLPLRISPLLSSRLYTMVEYHVGIDAKRVDKAMMMARGYKLTLSDSHFILELPVGSIDGYYKSHAPNYQYHITYSIEPMLEIIWKEDDLYDDTRYKVLFPITTPLMPRVPHVSDETVPEQRIFRFSVGTFLPDVELVNITFATGVLSVAEANARGFNVQEYSFSNGSKGFRLQVPFSDPVVLKGNSAPDVTVYTLPVVFGFLVLPENTPFPHPWVLEAALQDIVLPTATGTCDLEYFYVLVEYGNRGHSFVTIVGQRELTAAMAEEYSYSQNDTHSSMAVHFRSPDAVFEMVQASSVRSRLDLVLKDPVNNWNLNDFSLSCSFPMDLIECFSNGTMTALAVKVESVPDLIPSQLTLRDSRCKPAYSDHVFAYFSFNVNSCGTTRKFFSNVMMYENEVSSARVKTSAADDQYLFTVSCYYDINANYTMAFSTKPKILEPITVRATGIFAVRMRLALDSSYSDFYLDEHYPVVKYLREPLYFEVELMQATNLQVELFLENCWATSTQDRASFPKWDLIMDSCENLDDPYHTIFHPVSANSRVQFPSHFKRFEIKMFSFTTDHVALTGQIFVHCDVVICDASSSADRLCSMACMNRQSMTMRKRVQRSAEYSRHRREYVTSGPVVLA